MVSVKLFWFCIQSSMFLGTLKGDLNRKKPIKAFSAKKVVSVLMWFSKMEKLEYNFVQCI